MPNDPLTLVLMALSAVSSGLLFLFRQLMVEKDKSYDRLEKDCEANTNDLKADNLWLKGQLEEAQRNAGGTLAVMARAVDTQGLGLGQLVQSVATQGTSVKAILEILQATIDQRGRRER